MKYRILRWITEHESLSMLLLALPFCALFSCVLALQRAEWLSYLVLNALLLLISSIFVSIARSLCLNSTVHHFHALCDPEPTMREAERQLAIAKDDVYRKLLLINYYTMQSALGLYEKARDGLNTVNLDQSPAIPPYLKFVYYNNLSSVYDNLGQNEDAERHYQTAAHFYRTLKPKYQKACRISMDLLHAQAYIRNRTDLDRALQLLDQMSATNENQRVGRAFTRAQVYLLQNRIDEARADLDFVIAHGNKLALVAEARELLKGTEQS